MGSQHLLVQMFTLGCFYVNIATLLVLLEHIYSTFKLPKTSGCFLLTKLWYRSEANIKWLYHHDIIYV